MNGPYKTPPQYETPIYMAGLESNCNKRQIARQCIQTLNTIWCYFRSGCLAYALLLSWKEFILYCRTFKHPAVLEPVNSHVSTHDDAVQTDFDAHVQMMKVMSYSCYQLIKWIFVLRNTPKFYLRAITPTAIFFGIVRPCTEFYPQICVCITVMVWFYFPTRLTWTKTWKLHRASTFWFLYHDNQHNVSTSTVLVSLWFLRCQEAISTNRNIDRDSIDSHIYSHVHGRVVTMG